MSSSSSASSSLPSSTPEKKSELARAACHFVSGGVAGAVSRTIVSPLERLKILYMCGENEIRGSGVWSALRKIATEDGLRGLFRGNGANVIRIFPFSAVQLSSYGQFKVLVSGTKDDKALSVIQRFSAGVMSGILATTVTYPLDFIRSRLSLQGPSKQLYNGIWDGMKTVARSEGALALYTGLGVTLLGIIPYAGIQLSTYDIVKQFFGSLRSDGMPSRVDVFVSGAIGGMVAQTAAFPIELARRRLQVDGWATGVRQYSGFVDVVLKTVQSEGLRGLYRGLVPNFLKIIPAAGVSFVVFEQTKSFLGCEPGGNAPSG